MGVDETAGSVGHGDEQRSSLVDGSPRRDRPIAPADPEGRNLLDDLHARVAELDAIAWNLPRRAKHDE